MLKSKLTLVLLDLKLNLSNGQWLPSIPKRVGRGRNDHPFPPFSINGSALINKLSGFKERESCLNIN